MAITRTTKAVGSGAEITLIGSHKEVEAARDAVFEEYPECGYGTIVVSSNDYGSLRKMVIRWYAAD